MSKDRGVTLTLNLNGLTSMECAKNVLYEVEDAIEDIGMYEGTLSSDDMKSLSEVQRMQLEIERGGCGYELAISIDLIGETDE